MAARAKGEIVTQRGRRLALAALAAATLIGWLPVLGVLVSSLVASALHCALDEGSVHPCLVGGVDIGPALTFGFVAGWGVLATAPLILGSFVAWLVILVRALLHRARASRA